MLRRTSDTIAGEQTKTMWNRKCAKDSFTQALLLGFAEAKLRKETIPRFDHSISENFWQRATQICAEISQQIESGMWVHCDSQLNKDYSRKQKQLYASLRQDDNHELRMSLLCGKI